MSYETTRGIVDLVEIISGISSLGTGYVHHVDQDLGPFDMLEESEAHACAF